MREALFLLAALAGFALVGTIDADTAEAMLAEHAPATVIAALED